MSSKDGWKAAPCAELGPGWEVLTRTYATKSGERGDTRTVNEWRAPDGQRFRSMRAAEAERKSASAAATRTALPRVSLRPRPCCRI